MGGAIILSPTMGKLEVYLCGTLNRFKIGNSSLGGYQTRIATWDHDSLDPSAPTEDRSLTLVQPTKVKPSPCMERVEGLSYGVP